MLTPVGLQGLTHDYTEAAISQLAVLQVTQRVPTRSTAGSRRSNVVSTHIVQELDEVRAILLELPYPEVVPCAGHHKSNLLI